MFWDDKGKEFGKTGIGIYKDHGGNESESFFKVANFNGSIQQDFNLFPNLKSIWQRLFGPDPP